MADDASEPPKPKRNRWGEGPAADAPVVGATNGGGPPPPAAPSAVASSVLQAKELAKEALAKAQRAAEMQKAIATQMSSMVGLPPGAADAGRKPPTVTLDNQGRLLDERGKVIQSTGKTVATVKVNEPSAHQLTMPMTVAYVSKSMEAQALSSGVST